MASRFEDYTGDLSDDKLRLYDVFIDALKRLYPTPKFLTAKNIANGLTKTFHLKPVMTEPDIRKLRLLAWSRGVPISTGRNGYSYGDLDTMIQTRAHIESRLKALARDLQFIDAIIARLRDPEGTRQGKFL